MPFRATNSLLVQKGLGRRKEGELLKAFQEADKNGDGYLSMEEYMRVFEEHGVNITKEEVGHYFAQRDKDRDGRISYDEFCGRETVTEKAFKALDINEDGFISKPEMLEASKRGTRRLSKADVEACFDQYDHDKDNKLSYDEFCAMMNNRRKSIESGKPSEALKSPDGQLDWSSMLETTSKKYLVE